MHEGCNALLSLTLHGRLYYSCLLPGKIRLKLPSEISNYVRTYVHLSVCAAGLAQRVHYNIQLVYIEYIYNIIGT